MSVLEAKKINLVTQRDHRVDGEAQQVPTQRHHPALPWDRLPSMQPCTDLSLPAHTRSSTPFSPTALFLLYFHFQK